MFDNGSKSDCRSLSAGFLDLEAMTKNSLCALNAASTILPCVVTSPPIFWERSQKDWNDPVSISSKAATNGAASPSSAKKKNLINSYVVRRILKKSNVTEINNWTATYWLMAHLWGYKHLSFVA